MKIVSNTINILRTLQYIIKLGMTEGYNNPFKSLAFSQSKPAYILANGPSLKNFLEDTDNCPEKFAGVDFFVVNDFVKDKHFIRLKPKYCVMSDPLFFIETIYSERGHNAMQALADTVTWDMTLFIPWCYKKSKFLEPIRANKHISIVALHRLYYFGCEKFRNRIFKLGLGNGEYGTVALNAIYSAIMLGYKTIRLYGLDHTFFDNIAVNNQNQLCYKDTHFYGQDNALRPMLNHYNGELKNVKPFRVSEFLFEKANLFRGHEIMNDFARYMNVKIINCTPNSMVDEYVRECE